MLARVGEQSWQAAYALVNFKPSLANRSIFGVSSGNIPTLAQCSIRNHNLMQSKLINSIFLLLLFLAACTMNEDPTEAKKPEDNRFTRIILTHGMDEPMEMTFLPNEQVLIVEREGSVKIFDEKKEAVTLAGSIPVNTLYKNKAGRIEDAEEGLMGVVAHPDFSSNNWIFMYYADPDLPKHVLARWELRDRQLIDSSKKILLEIPTQREECCHTGGGMVFDQRGNLYLTTGNNTKNPRGSASNFDDRPGYENHDDQRGPSSTNDLRGKILRIRPEDDGSYTIPEGNLYPVGTPKTQPEIYTMGHRNPWRPSIDSQTSYLYWGEVGPDAVNDSDRGPRGYDEFNQAKGPGNYGWPYFVANNLAYRGYYPPDTCCGAYFDLENPINESANNTGLRELPPPVPALIWYAYGLSEEFLLLGSGARSATGGPIFRKADFSDTARVFPEYYEGKWFIIDFMRNWLMVVTLDDAGNYKGMEPFKPNERFNSAIDMDFGPSGDLYILEYGDTWFRPNSNAQLVKIEYNAGNRKPIVRATADKKAGAVPLNFQFSSEGTMDYDSYDQEALLFHWEIVSNNGISQTFRDPHPTVRFEQPGIYEVQLTVTDSKDASDQVAFDIVVGNQPPHIEIDLKGANRSFYFGDSKLPYSISINDKENGSSADGRIQREEVAITFDYIPGGFDPVQVAQNQSGTELLAIDAIGKNLIEDNDCRSCHQYDAKSIGPSYTDVSKKYRDTPTNRTMLAESIIYGSSGIWGEHTMAAHPQLNAVQAERMVRFILTFRDEKPAKERLPLIGTLQPTLPTGEDGQGNYLLRAAYQDKGANGLKPLTSEAFIVLRSPVVFPQSADRKENTQLLTTSETRFYVLAPRSHIAYNSLDMTGVRQIDVFVQTNPRVNATGGFIEVRLDSPDGKLIGRSEEVLQKTPPGIAIDNSQKAHNLEEIKAQRRRGSQKMTIIVEPVSGAHDVYFVFNNDEAKANEIMMTIMEIEFFDQKIDSQ